MPTAALRASMARSAAGALRNRWTGRGPLSLIASNRARTLGARFYAASKPSPPRPRAELDTVLANDEHAEFNPADPTGPPHGPQEVSWPPASGREIPMQNIQHFKGDARFLAVELQARAHLIPGVDEVSVLSYGMRKFGNARRNKVQLDSHVDQVS